MEDLTKDGFFFAGTPDEVAEQIAAFNEGVGGFGHVLAMVQGGTQALSRSLFASLVPRHLSGEFFAFFGVADKFAGIFGPAVFAATIAVTGSSRLAVLSVIGFFAVGALLLLLVDVGAGQREARAAEAALRVV